MYVCYANSVCVDCAFKLSYMVDASMWHWQDNIKYCCYLSLQNVTVALLLYIEVYSIYEELFSKKL